MDFSTRPSFTFKGNKYAASKSYMEAWKYAGKVFAVAGDADDTGYHKAILPGGSIATVRRLFGQISIHIENNEPLGDRPNEPINIEGPVVTYIPGCCFRNNIEFSGYPEELKDPSGLYNIPRPDDGNFDLKFIPPDNFSINYFNMAMQKNYAYTSSIPLPIPVTYGLSTGAYLKTPIYTHLPQNIAWSIGNSILHQKRSYTIVTHVKFTKNKFDSAEYPMAYNYMGYPDYNFAIPNQPRARFQNPAYGHDAYHYLIDDGGLTSFFGWFQASRAAYPVDACSQFDDSSFDYICPNVCGNSGGETCYFSDVVGYGLLFAEGGKICNYRKHSEGGLTYNESLEYYETTASSEAIDKLYIDINDVVDEPGILVATFDISKTGDPETKDWNATIALYPENPERDDTGRLVPISTMTGRVIPGDLIRTEGEGGFSSYAKSNNDMTLHGYFNDGFFYYQTGVSHFGRIQ